MSFLLSGLKSYSSKIFLKLDQSEKQSKSGNQRNKKVAKKPSMSKRSTKKTPVASLSDQDEDIWDPLKVRKSRVMNVLSVSAYTKMIFLPLVNYSLNELSVPILLVRSGCMFSAYS